MWYPYLVVPLRVPIRSSADLPVSVLAMILGYLDELKDLAKVWLCSRNEHLRAAVQLAAPLVVKNQDSWKMFGGAMMSLEGQEPDRKIVFQADLSELINHNDVGSWLWLLHDARVASQVTAHMKKLHPVYVDNEHGCSLHPTTHSDAFLAQLDRIPPSELERVNKLQYPMMCDPKMLPKDE